MDNSYYWVLNIQQIYMYTYNEYSVIHSSSFLELLSVVESITVTDLQLEVLLYENMG